MYCKLEGKHINIQNISPPAMNYGQCWRYKGLQKVSYEFNIPLSEFIEKTNRWFNDYRTESINDSKIELKGEYPLQDKYKENGFPILEEMILKHKSLLKEIIIFFDLEILNIFDCSSANAYDEKRYIINSLDWVKIENQVSFGGQAFVLS